MCPSPDKASIAPPTDKPEKNAWAQPDLEDFSILRRGIPDELPPANLGRRDPTVPHAPVRTPNLTPEGETLALRNALRYFDAKHHATLAAEFAAELRADGHVHMYRFRPTYELKAYPFAKFRAVCRCDEAACILLMVMNNLDRRVAQYPPGQDKRAKFPTSKPHISAVFHSFRLIFGRAIISRSALDAWMLSWRARAERSR